MNAYETSIQLPTEGRAAAVLTNAWQIARAHIASQLDDDTLTDEQVWVLEAEIVRLGDLLREVRSSTPLVSADQPIDRSDFRYLPPAGKVRS